MKYFFVVTSALIAVLSASSSISRELTPSEKEIVTKAIQVELINPDSAKIQWMDVSPAFDGKAFANYCVLVNSKNTYGGFSGFRPYMLLLFWGDKDGFNAKIGLNPDNEEYPEIPYKLCEEDGYRFEMPFTRK